MRHVWAAGSCAVTLLAAVSVTGDPPARVGRLNLISGAVSYRPAGVDDWAAAEPNRTITTGDALWTDLESRAEVHVGSTAVRLAERTEFDFLNVDDQTLQARLAQGTATVRIRDLDEGQIYEIDTPNGAISLGAVGEYRIDVGPDGAQSKLTVWSGGAEVTAAGSSFEVNAQQFATINGTDAPTFDLADVGPADDWDEWCLGRDRREDNARSLRYVSREMPGYEDLDDYGHWTFIAGYGNVWVPDRVGSGWAPYHTGHWVWRDPWGWTWVDEAPWGYAPYHYGRWAYVGVHWVWCPVAPGVAVTVIARPVFAPALVAFVGGPHWSLSAGFGGGFGAVAWVPLGPEEVYRPAYAVSPAYFRQVNVTNVTNVTNITNVTVVNNVVINNTTPNVTSFRNAGVPGAVVAVPQNAMVTSQPVSRVAMAVSRQQLVSAPAAGFAPPVAPTRQAVIGGGGGIRMTGGTVPVPPASVLSRPVVARVAPPPPVVPFAAKQSALAANGGKPLAPTQEAQFLRNARVTGATIHPLVKPATAPAAGVGLKPVRAGLPQVQRVQSVSPNGFVPHALAAPKVVAQPVHAASPTAPPARPPVTEFRHVLPPTPIPTRPPVTEFRHVPAPTPVPTRAPVTEFHRTPTPAPVHARPPVTEFRHVSPPTPVPARPPATEFRRVPTPTPVPPPPPKPEMHRVPTPTPVPVRHPVVQPASHPKPTPTPKGSRE